MDKVKRIYVEKKQGFNVEAKSLLGDLKDNLGIKSLQDIRIISRYDVSGLTEEEFRRSRDTVFAELPVDYIFEEVLPLDRKDRVFAREFLPGQYDQRSDSAAQCIQMLTRGDRPEIKTAKVIVLKGDITDREFAMIKNYCINPVDSREALLEKPLSLEFVYSLPSDVEVVRGFTTMNRHGLQGLMGSLGMAMSLDDLEFLQAYFRDAEKRDPSITELRVIDTYWSDHCRHTTFLTVIDEVHIEKGQFNLPVEQAYREYLHTRKNFYGDRQKDICLMDVATIGMKELKQKGLLDDLDESEEINACSIVVNTEVNGRNEEWLVMFKNETHNHPTEIEPFGGAATCLGGAIRDPLSGRSYVYQAMRVTGSGDPRTGIEDTLPGKLPQRKITTEAASGYSSYGNQIGLATGQVAEVYDQGFLAKRMEIGAVIGATPRDNVARKTPVTGDVVILVGGRTGRDGCGGATGSSKAHTEESILTCGAEVQKGNPPEERKIQRLFRNPRASRMIKRCNDFGAGGVAVAIGELAEGLEIDLDAVPKKYEGLDGTELAISESQERMAVVVDSVDAESLIGLAREENLEATVVAKVTDTGRLKMTWRGKTIVDISRDFLNSNGVKQHTNVRVTAPDEMRNYFETLPDGVQKECDDLRRAWLANLRALNVCSQKGLVERFDSTIGAGSVLMPFGGLRQASPVDGMVAKLPVLDGDTTTGTAMAYGYSPELARWSPFHGAVYAVVESVAKIVALGGSHKNIRLSLQEYFEKLGKSPAKWGKPFSALLGAFYAQKNLGIAAIGGKDSMSGSFKDLDVPPTLVSFAVTAVDVRQVISPEFKQANSLVALIPVPRDASGLPDFEIMNRNFSRVHELVREGKVLAACPVKAGGIAAAASKMAFGNRIGVIFEAVNFRDLFLPGQCSLVLELDSSVNLEEVFGQTGHRLLGRTTAEPVIIINNSVISLNSAYEEWASPLETVFPTKVAATAGQPQTTTCSRRSKSRPALTQARPRVFIPVFPGTNCEYDSARAFEKAGGISDLMVVRNLTSVEIEQSMQEMVRRIEQAQIIMIPGGFSAGDEPDGSGKFIAAVFRNPQVKEAVLRFLKERDGLMLGICNGFQAMIKLGLVPYGEIRELAAESPTLTFNTINRHASCLVRTKVVSTLSPWLNSVTTGDVHTVAISHGEGRFVAGEEDMDRLFANGQVATQYVDQDGRPTYDIAFNPNGSMHAIEGITSPDGRVLGKMAHSERYGSNVLVNVPGEKDQKIFEAGIRYFL